VKDLAAEKNTPHSLATEINTYIKKHHPTLPSFDYSTVFRRMLWVSRADADELKAFPEHNLCKHWSRYFFIYFFAFFNIKILAV
jgi:hypothetical protein